MRNLLKAVDSINEHVALSGRWLCLALVLVGVYDVVLRYAFDAPTVWAYETSSMLGGSIYALGWGYSLLRNSHIRVDIFFSRLSERGKAIADSILSLIFFFPLTVILAIESTSWAITAWERGEVMKESYWYVPAGPFRTVIAVGVILLLMQGIAKLIRDVHFATRSRSID